MTLGHPGACKVGAESKWDELKCPKEGTRFVVLAFSPRTRIPRITVLTAAKSWHGCCVPAATHKGALNSEKLFCLEVVSEHPASRLDWFSS